MSKFKNLTDEDINKAFLGRKVSNEYKPKTIKDIYDSFEKYLNDTFLINTKPSKLVIDFHTKTVEESWKLFNESISKPVKKLIVITGASGILHKEFPKWLDNPNINKRIISWKPLNNGSYELILHRL